MSIKKMLIAIYEWFYEKHRLFILRTKYRLRILSPEKTIKYIKKHKPVGVIAYNVKSQEEYLSVAMHCDNIIFDSFRPEI